MKVTLLVPTLNEAVGMRSVMPKVKKEWVDQVLIVDGKSKDGTADIAFDTGGTNNWPDNRISPVQNSVNGFSVGERVVTDNHYEGTIQKTYVDGTVDIAFDTGRS